MTFEEWWLANHGEDVDDIMLECREAWDAALANQEPLGVAMAQDAYQAGVASQRAEIERVLNVRAQEIAGNWLAMQTVVEAARRFRGERAKLSRPIDEPNHTERAWLALLNALSTLDAL